LLWSRISPLSARGQSAPSRVHRVWDARTERSPRTVRLSGVRFFVRRDVPRARLAARRVSVPTSASIVCSRGRRAFRETRGRGIRRACRCALRSARERRRRAPKVSRHVSFPGKSFDSRFVSSSRFRAAFRRSSHKWNRRARYGSHARALSGDADALEPHGVVPPPGVVVVAPVPVVVVVVHAPRVGFGHVPLLDQRVHLR
jgi:hypothetical protein